MRCLRLQEGSEGRFFGRHWEGRCSETATKRHYPWLPRSSPTRLSEGSGGRYIVEGGHSRRDGAPAAGFRWSFTRPKRKNSWGEVFPFLATKRGVKATVDRGPTKPTSGSLFSFQVVDTRRLWIAYGSAPTA